MSEYVGLDLSTKTGVVILNEAGEAIHEEEIKNRADTPARMIELIETVSQIVDGRPYVAIEGFGFNSRQGFQLGGIGWGMRMSLYQQNITPMIVAPNTLKKFATGAGNADKRKVAVKVSERWNYFHESDNVTDAYVLAQVYRHFHQSLGTKQQKEALQKINFE